MNPDAEGLDLPGIVSLYSGAGGLDLGFRAAGFNHVVAVDSSAAAVASWNHNLRSGDASVGDLDGQAVIDDIRTRVGGRRVGVVGGPPCQGFSRARANGVRDDPRLRSPLRFVEICEALAGVSTLAFVVLENVDALVRDRHGDLVEMVSDRLSALGLVPRWTVLQACDHGVPQRRSRAFLIALAEAFEVPAQTSTSMPDGCATVRDAIHGLPTPSYNTPGPVPVIGEHHPNHVTSRPTSPRFETGSFNRWRSFRRLEWDAPSPTVAYGNREIHVHPDGRRRLSVFEAMRLQGFAEDHRLFGTFSEQVQQVSNAVPPPLAEAVARSVADALTAATRVGRS